MDDILKNKIQDIKLKKIFFQKMHSMDVLDLMKCIYSSKVQEIKCESKNHGRDKANVMLLDIAPTYSGWAKEFLDALFWTGQGHLAELVLPISGYSPPQPDIPDSNPPPYTTTPKNLAAVDMCIADQQNKFDEYRNNRASQGHRNISQSFNELNIGESHTSTIPKNVEPASENDFNSSHQEDLGTIPPRTLDYTVQPTFENNFQTNSRNVASDYSSRSSNSSETGSEHEPTHKGELEAISNPKLYDVNHISGHVTSSRNSELYTGVQSSVQQKDFVKENSVNVPGVLAKNPQGDSMAQDYSFISPEFQYSTISQSNQTSLMTTNKICISDSTSDSQNEDPSSQVEEEENKISNEDANELSLNSHSNTAETQLDKVHEDQNIQVSVNNVTPLDISSSSNGNTATAILLTEPNLEQVLSVDGINGSELQTPVDAPSSSRVQSLNWQKRAQRASGVSVMAAKFPESPKT